MPTLDKNVTIKIPKGSITAQAKQNRHQEAVSIAWVFNMAVQQFVKENNRQPDWDKVNFYGGTTSTEVIFEIVEVAENGQNGQ